MLDNYPKFKKFLHYLLMHPYATRPRLWTRIFIIPFLVKRARGSIIRHRARLDLIPSKRFVVGYRAVIEDYVTINNGMGDVFVGDHTQITSRVTIVGPVTIGNRVTLANGAHVSGLTHNYDDITKPFQLQGVSTKRTIIEDDVWIGGNACVNQGVTIGTHTIIGSGSVVTKDIPPYSVAVGNPARIVRRYDFEQKVWIKVSN